MHQCYHSALPPFSKTCIRFDPRPLSSWLLTSEFEPELSLSSSSELPFALSSLLGVIGTSLAEDSLTSAVFALFAGGSTGAQTGVRSNLPHPLSATVSGRGQKHQRNVLTQFGSMSNYQTTDLQARIVH